MAKKSIYPKTIHVVRETPNNDEPYLLVLTPDSGFATIDTTREVAIYQLVTTGLVTVTKVFEDNRR